MLADDEVLRLAHQGADTTQRGTDGGMHHQAAQEGTKIIEILAIELGDFLIVGMVMAVTKLFAGRDLVIDSVKAGGDADHHGNDRQGIEKS